MRLFFKILVVFGLTVALLIPLSMIRGTVQDRQSHRTRAVEEVARSTAGAQALAGPVLFVPYTDRVVTLRTDERGIQRRVEQVRRGTWTFFPQTLDVRGRLQSLPRMRGLHEVRVFELATRVRATFRVTIPRSDEASTRRTVGPARLGMGLRDVRGLFGVPSLLVAGTPRTLRQGLGQDGGSGLHAVLDAPAAGQSLAFDVDFQASLQGTETLSIVPLAGRNAIALESSWPHPQFHGDFLPRSREIHSDGFRARWEVSSLASNAQAQYRAASRQAEPGPAVIDSISVSLVDPVNVYSQVDRATKYGVLFVLLTFVAFFVFELLRQLRIHPIQYGLVGLAISIFFLLLLALSERVAFGLAYLAAAVACVGLIGYYLGHVLGGWKRGAGFAAMLGTLYAALYGLLISEDNAMVLGAGLLFVVLAAIMVLTRRIDWYESTVS
ncbi:MAG TPA: cell envelope integrity protein CreD [Steroidobacteraceae bacterium]|nr:cell envelope integrity protein CreD [Steroidobacteraceae bacterium]